MAARRCAASLILAAAAAAATPTTVDAASDRAPRSDLAIAMTVRSPDRRGGATSEAALSRRLFLPLAASGAAAAAGLGLLPGAARADVGGGGGGGGGSAAAPLRPPPMAGGTAAVVPGLAAPLRPVVVDGEGGGWTPLPPVTELGRSRILAADLPPLGPSLSPLAGRETYYPPFLFGSWDVTATLRRKVYPYGTEFAPSRSLVEGSPRNLAESVGDSTTYDVRFFSAVADDGAANKEAVVNVDLGAPRAKAKIIADRAYNAISISRAYRQLTPVREVEWDPRKDPTRLTLSFGAGPLTEDMMPLGQRRAEIYVTGRRSEGGADGETFCASERTRQVYLMPGNVQVSDTERITEFRVVREGDDGEGSHVRATCRIAVYLTPNPNSREGVLWEQVRGRAVAFFDYEFDMRRRYEEIPESGGEVRACVRTPKDVLQCA